MKRNLFAITALCLSATLCYPQEPIHPGGRKGCYASYTPLELCKSESHPDMGYGFRGDQSRYMQYRPLYIREETGKPIPTNDWWTNLITQPYSGRLWSYPQFVQAQSYGVDVQHPSYWIADGTEMKSNSVVTIKSPKFRPSQAIATSWHDWDVSFEMEDGKQRLTTTMAHGAPFTWIEMEGMTPEIGIARSYQASADFEASIGEVLNASGEAITTTTSSDDTFILRLGTDLYGIYLPSGSSVTIDKSAIKVTFSDNRQWVVVACLNAIGDLETYRQYAYSVPRDTRVDWNYSAGKLHTTWQVDAIDLRTGESTDQVVQGFLPHQYRNTRYDGATDTTLPYLGNEYTTPHGRLRLVKGANIGIDYTFSGMLPYYPLPDSDDLSDHPYDPERMKEMIELYASSGTFGDDTYWGGKGLTQMALNMMFAREMGETELFDTCRRRLKEALVDWMTWTPGETTKFFARYDRWGGMVGYRTSYDSETFNDHHFHYGYFTYAAALLAMVDNDFRQNYGDMITLIAKDYANWDRDDSDYPLFRTFDPWAGHSFAGGMGDDNGNGQESTSEAMQGWGGLYLLGVALGNDAMRDAGIFGWVSESRGTAEYWFDRHGAEIDSQFHQQASDDYNIRYDLFVDNDPSHTKTYGRPHPYNSNLTCHGVGYWTYFGYDAIFMQGIQWMPISPCLDYLGEDKAFASWDYNRMIADTDQSWETFGDWGNVALSYLQYSDPAAAARQFDAMYSADTDGFTRRATTGISYFVTHSHATHGDYDWQAYASIPTARKYVKDGVTTYVAYNPGDTPIDVTFSDGYTLTDVQPRRMAVSGRESLDHTDITPVDDSEADPRQYISMINLAYHCPVTTSSDESGTLSGACAVDEDESTRWASSYADGQWISIDLGKEAAIYKVKIKWETAYPLSYKIQLSDDGESWRDIADIFCDGGWDEHLLQEHTGRYLRLLCGERQSENWGVSLWELQVFGEYTDASAGDLLGIDIIAPTAVIKQGEASQLTARGYTVGRQWVDLPDITWNCDPDQGTITSAGIFTPAIYPRATVQLHAGTHQISKDFVVEEAIFPAYITLSSASLSVAKGETFDLGISLLNQFEEPIADPDPTTWQVIFTDSEGEPTSDIRRIDSLFIADQIGSYHFMVTSGEISAEGIIEVCEPEQINLALSEKVGGNARAYATSSSGSGSASTAELAIDGNPATRWEAPASEITREEDVTWTLDLGAIRTFNAIKIDWENAYSRSFIIEVSDDDENYHPIIDITDGNLGNRLSRSYGFESQTGRYIRLTNRGRSTQYGVSFYELGVYNLSEGLTPAEIALTTSSTASHISEPIKATIAALDQLGSPIDVDHLDFIITPADGSEMKSESDGTYSFIARQAGTYTITATYGTITSPTAEVTIVDAPRIAIDPDSMVTPLEGTNSGSDLANAFDDNTDSLWILHDNTAESDTDRTYDVGVEIDFGTEIRYLSAIRIKFEGACSQDYDLEVAENDGEYRHIFSYRGAEGIDQNRNDFIIIPMARAEAAGIKRIEAESGTIDTSTPTARIRFISSKAATGYGVKIKDFSIYGSDEPIFTGIATVDDTSEEVKLYYNLQGEKISRPDRGIYIEVIPGKRSKKVVAIEAKKGRNM